MIRSFERAKCPLCDRNVSVYVPHMADGTDVKFIRHNSAYSKRLCEASDRMLGEMVRPVGRKFQGNR